MMIYMGRREQYSSSKRPNGYKVLLKHSVGQNATSVA